MDKSTNAPLLIDDETITSKAVFTPEESEGTVEVEFTFDVTGLAGKEIVVFEEAYREDVLLAVHADIEDHDQSIRVREPKIGTKAAVGGEKEVDPFGVITLTDTVS